MCKEIHGMILRGTEKFLIQSITFAKTEVITSNLRYTKYQSCVDIKDPQLPINQQQASTKRNASITDHIATQSIARKRCRARNPHDKKVLAKLKQTALSFSER